MDMSSAWISQLEMQDHQGLMNQYQMIKPYQVVGNFSTVDSFSTDCDTKNPSFLDQTFQIPPNIKEMPNIKRIPSFKTTNNIIKKLTPADENQNTKPKPTPLPDSPNTFTISFGDLKPKDEVIALSDSFGYTDGTKKGPTMIRNRIQLQDHMLAERKRREKLARRFVYLSSLLPGLKKMDKATVLEDAANYIQELQCRLKELEGSSNLKTENLKSDISAKKPKLISCSNDDGFSADEAKFVGRHSSCSPEIEVRMSGISVLVRIYCQKNYLSLLKVFSEMQKLDLSVTSSSTLPFGSFYLIITIVAKKKDDFLMTSSDLVKNLKLAISTLEDDIQLEVQDCHSNKLEFEYNELDEN